MTETMLMIQWFIAKDTFSVTAWLFCPWASCLVALRVENLQIKNSIFCDEPLLVNFLAVRIECYFRLNRTEIV
jgi:hypothetical protein